MLDKRFLLQNRDVYVENVRKRGVCDEYDLFLSLNKEYLNLKKRYDSLKFEQKSLKESNERSLSLKEELFGLQESLRGAREKLDNWLVSQPNILLNDVPFGVNSDDNLVIYQSDIPVKKSLPHYELIENFIMFDESNNLSGSGFVVLKDKLAQLKRALVNFMLDHNKENGYDFYDVPYIVNSSAFFGTGQFPKFKDECFILNNDQCLISTGEISLVNLFSNKIFEDADLPKLCTTYTPCFRKEAGASGKDMKGLIRLHQFHKVELVTICKPEDSEYFSEKQRTVACNILEALHIPYRVVSLCSGDTGFSACETFDIEVWLPGSSRFLEIASCSQCGDFQSRRANIKFKGKDGLEYVYTLNGSSLPLERLLVAIVENHYDKETNSIIIPNILRDYMRTHQILLNESEDVDF